MTAFIHRLSASQPDAILDKMIEEITDKLQAGESVDLSEYVSEDPARLERLRRLLPALKMIAELGDSPVAIPTLAGSEQDHSNAGMGTLGDFRINREVGRGGMGVVYEAEQMSLGRRIALKVLPFAATLDPKQLQRFKSEAQAAAHLHHTNIVPVFAVGCERGVHYYAMQFIEGQSLAEAIKGLRQLTGLDPVDPSLVTRARPELAANDETQSLGPKQQDNHVELDSPASPSSSVVKVSSTLSTDGQKPGKAYFRTVAELGVQAAEALDYAHEQGVLHRDIKPANLLVDVKGNLWITDFGLARFLNEASLTMTGDLLGTLRYMSPEQALAKRVIVDHRTDIYSLGVTLYELLTLQPVFDGDRQEVMRQIAFSEPKPLQRLNRAIPHELETIVLKAMAKDPASRYGTAKELAEDLERFLHDKPIRARRPNPFERVSMWSRRHKPVVATATLLLGLCLIGSLVASFYFNRLAGAERKARGQVTREWNHVQELLGNVTRERNRANAALQEADRRAAENKEVVDFLISDMIGSASPAVTGGETLTVDKVLARAGDRIPEKFKDRPLIEASIRLALAKVYENLGQFRKSEEHATRAAALRLSQLGPQHEATIEAQNSLGWALVRQGRETDANSLMTQVVETARKALGPHHEKTLGAIFVLAVAREGLGKHEEARSLYEEGVSTSASVWGPDNTMTLEFKVYLAYSHVSNGNPREGLQLEKEVLARGLRDWPKSPWTYCRMSDVAYMYRNIGEFHSAAEMALQGAEGKLRIYGPAHPFTLSSLGELLNYVHGSPKHEQKAQDILEQALERARHEIGPTARETASLLKMRAQLSFEQGQTDEWLVLARELCETLQNVADVQRRTQGPANAETIANLDQLVDSFTALGRWDEAAAIYEQVCQAQPERYDVETVHGPWYPLAVLKLSRGDAAGYRRLCAEMLDRFGRTKNEQIAEQVAKICTLAPEAIADTRPAVALARMAVAAEVDSGLECWDFQALGAAEYRAGQLNAALQALAEARVRHAVGVGKAEVGFLLSMVHYRLGQIEEAQRALSEANRLLRESDTRVKRSCPPLDAWLALEVEICHVLRREAEVLMAGNGFPDNPFVAGRSEGAAIDPPGSRMNLSEMSTEVQAGLLLAHGRTDDAIALVRRVPETQANLGPVTLAGLRETAELQRRTRGPAEPETLSALDRLAEYQAAHGRWNEAIAAYEKARKAKPERYLKPVGGPWYALPVLRLRTGEVDAYRHLCSELLERFGGTEDPYIAEQVAKSCTFLPAAVQDMTRATELARMAVKHDDVRGWNQPDRGSGWHMEWNLLALGAAEYRAGHFVASLKWLGQASDLNQDPKAQAQTRFFQAMAHQELGQYEEARRALSEGVQLLGELEVSARFGLPNDPGWRELEVCRLLRQEAEALVLQGVTGSLKPQGERAQKTEK